MHPQKQQHNVTEENRNICDVCILLRDSVRLSPSPFVFCVIYGYCMTFGETRSPDKRTFLTIGSGHLPSAKNN